MPLIKSISGIRGTLKGDKHILWDGKFERKNKLSGEYSKNEIMKKIDEDLNFLL